MVAGKPNTAATFLNKMLAKCESPAIVAQEEQLLAGNDAAKAKAYVCKRIVACGKLLNRDRKTVEQVQACMKQISRRSLR